MQGSMHFRTNDAVAAAADQHCSAGTAMLQEQRRDLLCQTTGAAHESTRLRITALL
jgi:hypothetical protein